MLCCGSENPQQVRIACVPQKSSTFAEERAAKMDVGEIKDLTLDLARTGDRIE